MFSANLGVGAAFGVGAYLVTYVLTYVFTAIDGVRVSGEIATWKAVGWVFYAAQFVNTQTTISAGGQSQTQSINPITDATATADITSTIPGFVYHLAPVVVLVVAGYLVAQRIRETSTTETAAAAGATVVVGYLVLGVVGRFLFTVSQSSQIGSASVGPELLMSVVLLGIVYPVVFGGIGGVLATQ